MTSQFAVDWDREPLGVVPDADLVRKHGVTRQAVLSARQARGIPNAPGERRGRKDRFDWDRVPLGMFPDQVLADLLGCCRLTIINQRAKKSIPPFRDTVVEMARAELEDLGFETQ